MKKLYYIRAGALVHPLAPLHRVELVIKVAATSALKAKSHYPPPASTQLGQQLVVTLRYLGIAEVNRPGFPGGRLV